MVAHRARARSLGSGRDGVVLGADRRVRDATGFVPMLTLHHFTSPQWFAEKGGFTWEHAPESFAAVHASSRPRTWVRAFLSGARSTSRWFWSPALISDSSCRLRYSRRSLPRWHVINCSRVTFSLTTFFTLKSRERKGPWKDHPISVGIAHNMIDFMPERWWHLIEWELARTFDRFYNRAWLDAVTGKRQHFGVAGLVPGAPQAHRSFGTQDRRFSSESIITPRAICNGVRARPTK